MEHGEYAPLELLLATNRLGYDDYRAWRECRLGTLDAVLADRKREICAWLDGAQSWACALGLAAEPAVHHGLEENAGTVLVASADPRLNALLSTRFRHTREHDRVNLFIDRAQTAADNALIDALTARNANEVLPLIVQAHLWIGKRCARTASSNVAATHNSSSSSARLRQVSNRANETG